MNFLLGVLMTLAFAFVVAILEAMDFYSNKIYWLPIFAGCAMALSLWFWNRMTAAQEQKLETLVKERTEQLAKATERLEREALDRKQMLSTLEDNHRFLTEVINAIPYPFYVIDVYDYSIKIANRTAYDGTLPEGMKCHALSHKSPEPCNSNEHPCPVREALRTKKSVTVEHIHFDADGNPRDVEVHGFPIFDREGNIILLIEYAMDITQRKRQEVELRIAKQQAEDANMAKSGFLAFMSHEIRTPLNAVVGMVRLALGGQLNDEQREYLLIANEASENLTSILTDILDLSKIEAGKLDLVAEDFDLSEEVEAVEKVFRAMAQQKGVAIVTDIDGRVPARVRADSLRLRQVLTNLLSNALKFTDHGSVTISVKLIGAEAGGTALVEFMVKDTGTGIPQHKQERIFEGFRQADAHTSHTYGGSGLGLTISRLLVSMMGGELKIASSPGLGSSFYFTVPLGRALAPAEPEPFMERALQPDGQSYKVLLVEDNRFNQILAERVLIKAGHSVSIAGNGLEALDKLRQEPFDLVLMDVQMPELDGIETTQCIRRGDSVPDPHIPIIAMTAQAMKGDRERCLEAGMNDYVSKPLDVALLLNSIAKCMAHQKQK